MAVLGRKYRWKQKKFLTNCFAAKSLFLASLKSYDFQDIMVLPNTIKVLHCKADGLFISDQPYIASNYILWL